MPMVCGDGLGDAYPPVFFIKETYPPTILVSKAEELRRRSKNWAIHAKQEEVEADLYGLVEKNFARPICMPISKPILLLITTYPPFIYGLLYTFLTAYRLVFQGVHGMGPRCWRPPFPRHGHRHCPRRYSIGPFAALVGAPIPCQ